jgi:apolipoprotein N-acyltransferase
VTKLFLQLISFVCVALGQPAWIPWLGPLAASMGFALHWGALDGLSVKTAQRQSFLWFFCVQLIQLSWMVRFEYLGYSIFFVYLLLAAGMALQFAWMTKFLFRNRSFQWLSVASVASFWTLMEWVRLQFFCGFTFNSVGVALSCFVWPLQMATISGIFGMSFWVILTNLIALEALRSRVWKSWVVIALFPYIYGCVHVWYQDAKQKTNLRTVSALLVQPAIPLSQKYPLKGKEKEFVQPIMQLEKLMRLVSSYRNETLDLLVFPEAVLPWGFDRFGYSERDIRALFEFYFGKEALVCFPPLTKPFYEDGRVSNAYCMQALANFFQAPVVSGLDFQDEMGLFFNSAFYFEPGSVSSPSRYDKRVLLPFAEYMPCSWLSFLSRMYGIEDFFQRGTEVKIWGSIKISPSICYEELFSSVMREGRGKGSNLFVNLTNDGYYPSSKLPLQHFSQGLIHSVENGVPLVRACNTGVTAVVDSLGRVVGILQDVDGGVERVSGCLRADVPMGNYKTLFSFWGDLPLILMCMMFLGVVIGKERSFLLARL